MEDKMDIIVVTNTTKDIENKQMINRHNIKNTFKRKKGFIQIHSYFKNIVILLSSMNLFNHILEIIFV